MELHFTKKRMFQIASVLAGLVIVFLVIYASFPDGFKKNDNPEKLGDQAKEKIEFPKGYLEGVKRFASEDEFYQYLEAGDLENMDNGWRTLNSSGFGMAALPGASMMETGLDASAVQEKMSEPDRFSSTNVQVAGIDEPDIAKTDGENIYYSREQYWRSNVVDRIGIESWEEQSLLPAPVNEVDIVRAFPPGDLKKISKIEKKGKLLLKDKILAVIAADGIYSYDINGEEPVEIWNLKLNNNTTIVSARLFGDNIYLVSQTQIYRYRTCPIEPYTIGEEKMTIDCSDIYRPENVIPINSTFQVASISMESGKAENSVTFVGSTLDTQVYMSPKNIYVTYTFPGDFIQIISDFFDLNNGLVPDELEARIKKLKEYDISAGSKMNEINQMLEAHISSLSDDDQLRLRNELNDKMGEFISLRQRDLESTGVVKVGVADLSVKINGLVPGHPLNQFSLDEYQGDLRIATTIGRNMWWFPYGNQIENANDVYILDEELKIKSSVKDLGKGERIYAVRFIGDVGYVVTFKQIDPFYVLDLSDSVNPRVSGELKIPGYSSYLHPIDDGSILGIGMENQKVKISLFDVSDPANPRETDKYSLDEYWTDVSNTHHAFMLDGKHQIFFLPGGEGGYIFSYRDEKLELVKAVSDMRAKRALYINDYLYVLGDEKITVINEKDWETVNELNY